MERRGFLTTAGAGVLFLAGCTGSSESSDVKDTDGDGVIDSEDYAPRDPEVQAESDAVQTPTPEKDVGPADYFERGTPTPEKQTIPPAILPSETPTPEKQTIPPDLFDTETIIDDRDTVNEDKYLYYEFSLNEQKELQLKATVRSGPRLDIMLMDRSEFEEYEAGRRFRYDAELSLMDTIGGDSRSRVNPADLVLVVDNTEAGEATPPTDYDENPARVELTLTASRL